MERKTCNYGCIPQNCKDLLHWAEGVAVNTGMVREDSLPAGHGWMTDMLRHWDSIGFIEFGRVRWTGRKGSPRDPALYVVLSPFAWDLSRAMAVTPQPEREVMASALLSYRDWATEREVSG